jgi:site-specific recombinase XerD
MRSIFSFAMGVGYIRVNPAAMLDTPKVPNNLAARIMTEEQVLTMLALEENERNRVILCLLYEGALRVSELCGLTWANVQPNATTGGQVTVTGKGDKSRSIPISKAAYDMLLVLRNGADYDTPVFTSRWGNDKALTRVQVFHIVAAAAKRAGIPENVSPHWLRHAHASHALDRGAPIHLVKETLGFANIVTTNNYAHARPSESSSTFLVTATK